MKYIYNPVTGTLDDVETPNLGEKYFASAETDALKDMMNEQFGPGTIKYGSEIDQPEMKTPQAIYEFGQRNPAANGGMMRQNFVAGAAVAPLLSYPATLGMAKIFGISTAGVGATELGNKVTDYLKENPEVMDTPQFRGIALAFGINIPNVIAPDADEMEREAEKIREMTKPTGFPAETEDMPIKTGETTKPEIDTKESFPADTQQLPTSTGGSEIPEQTLKDFIFYNKKAPVEKKYPSEKEYGEKALEKLDPKALNEINNLVNNYRKTKTRTENIYIEPSTGQKKVRDASTQAVMNDQEKLELLELVVNKYKEKENKPPSATELKALLPFYSNPSKIARDNNIELSVRTASYDRSDPSVVKQLKETAQSKAIENNTIVVSKDTNFFPKNIKLKNGSVVNAEQFFINNLTERTELGPRRPETKERTLTNKQLAELFNTNERNIKRVIANVKNSPDFQADYPEPRKQAFYIKQAADRIKKAREYLTMKELANVKLQEQQLKKLNSMFKDGTLVITDYPNLIKSLNTTMDKETGILDHSIKKTKKDLLKKIKRRFWSFDISHTIGKTTEQQNIEFLRNRNVSDYKTNQALYKSMESYVKNKIDDPEYDLRLEEFDAYIKEMGQRVKIGNKFFGLDEAMINSETGEFTGINRQLEYYGLPKFENGVPLKKVKKADGGVIPDQEIMNYATGGRVNFQDGTPNPQLEGNDFLNELEFKFNNIDNVTLDDTPITFDDSKSSAAQVADLFNPKNIPYYADMAVRAGLRVGEFGTRILPATGQLISDVLQKPMFKVKSSYAREDDNEILDYGETPENNNVKFVGGPIFKNFLKNITPTSTEKLVGLDTIINEEKKKMIERGSSSLPVKVAETAALGGELIAPIFPGLKLLRAYAKSKSLPVNDDTKQLLEQDVDMVLESNGMDRRQFLQITGTGGAVILAKMLGFGDEFATATKVTEKATAKAATTVPPYFFELVSKIKKLGDDITPKGATQDLQRVYEYKGYNLYEDVATGDLRIEKIGQESGEMITEREILSYTKGQADETTKVKPADEYEEVTEINSRIEKDRFNDPDYEEGVNIEEILKDFQ